MFPHISLILVAELGYSHLAESLNNLTINRVVNFCGHQINERFVSGESWIPNDYSE